MSTQNPRYKSSATAKSPTSFPAICDQASALKSRHSTECGQKGVASKSTVLPATQRGSINTRPVQNRIFAVMMHTTRYAFKAQARLAADCRVAPSTICRLLTGHSSPSFALVATITKTLEKHLGRPLDPRELVSTDSQFPTLSTCALCGCRGCLPDEAYDENERLRPEYKGVAPGSWTLLSSQSVRRALDEEQREQSNTQGKPKQNATPQILKEVR